ncbi:SPFH domain-containing protein [Zavarzinia sp. CC-PAN008]|uniref:SPFH domain-containing protein n=1 Tax=Zavarzinia sp. CC-PAN008 TaxID=3243332 RepID=UPI003F749CBF
MNKRRNTSARGGAEPAPPAEPQGPDLTAAWGSAADKIKQGGRSMRFTVILGIIGAIFVMVALASTYYTVDQGELGVQLRNGRVIAVAEPGLHFQIPMIDSVVIMSTRTEKLTEDQVSTYSRDIQEAMLRISVNYRLDPSKVEAVYSSLGRGGEDRIIRPAVMRRVKEVMGQYDARTIVADRAKLGVAIEEAVRQSVEPHGFLVESVQMENVDFSPAYEQAIENAMQAQALTQKAQQELELRRVEAQKAVVDAEAQAKVRLAQAQADAEAVRLRGQAEAEAIKARGDALRDNPNLIALTQAERWDGRLPSTMLPGGAVPMLSLGGNAGVPATGVPAGGFGIGQ